MASSASYAFDETGKVIAFDGKHVIAKGEDFSKVAETADEYFGAMHQRKSDQEKAAAQREATHITTPNGQKGVVLGRTEGLWSDEITVRFDNNQIRRFATFVGDGLKYSAEDPIIPKSPIEYFERRLDATYTPSRDGLTARLQDLDEIRKEASGLASQNPSYGDAQALHRIVLTANSERGEVREALEHLETVDAEAFAAPKSAYAAVEQASVGPQSDWLDVVARDMVAESEDQDFDKLLADGPTLLVSSMEIGALADAGVVRELAVDHILGRTAGFQGEAVEEYRDKFVAATELARRKEFTYRKDETKQAQQKEAAITENVPDAAVFL